MQLTSSRERAAAHARPVSQGGAQQTAVLAGRGTVVAARTRGSHAAVTVRDAKGNLIELRVRRDTKLVSGDGHALLLADVQPGDTVRFARGRIQDLSQRLVDATGVVAYESALTGDPLIVNLKGRGNVVVDMEGGTAFSDLTHQTSSSATIEDADLVRIQGMFDVTLGEMTETSRITRLGPALSAKSEAHTGSRP